MKCKNKVYHTSFGFGFYSEEPDRNYVQIVFLGETELDISV